MKYLSNRYIAVYQHKGQDICTLKKAETGDDMAYRIDSEQYAGRSYATIQDAISDIG